MTPADQPGPVRMATKRSRKVLTALSAAAAAVLIAVVITVMAGGSGAGTTTRPARAADSVRAPSAAAALPVVYGQVAGWHSGQVKPAAVYVGEGGAPYVKALKWPGWTAAGAHANGELLMQKPGCARPAYQCPYQRFRVKVQLSLVQIRDGVRYYSRMSWTYISNHRQRVIRWKTDKGYWRN
jgi:hypothetical protein